MVAEHGFLNDARRIDISKRQWVVAIGCVLMKELEDRGIEPTSQELTNFLRNIDPIRRMQLNRDAHALVTEEYEALYTFALMNGFDKKTAISQTRKIIKKRYEVVEDDDAENFFYLDPLIFTKFN